MRSVQTLGSTQDQRPWISPACLALAGTATGSASACLTFMHPPSCPPLLHAHYGASQLVWGLCLLGKSPPPLPRSPRFTSHVLLRPFCLQPPNAPPSPLSHATPQLNGLPSRVRASPLIRRLAGYVRPNRVRQILRTGLSPPVAPHPASRRRSYLRLQAGERMPEEDFHLSERVRSRAHGAPASRRPANFVSCPLPLQQEEEGDEPPLIHSLSRGAGHDGRRPELPMPQ